MLQGRGLEGWGLGLADWIALKVNSDGSSEEVPEELVGKFVDILGSLKEKLKGNN